MSKIIELEYQVLAKCPYCGHKENLAYADPASMFCSECDASIIEYNFELCPQMVLFIEK